VKNLEFTILLPYIVTIADEVEAQWKQQMRGFMAADAAKMAKGNEHDLGGLSRGREKTMPNDSHQRAAEFHELAAHAHRAAAAHHGEEDHQTGHEHSKQAMEHANKAFQSSKEAHRKSEKSTGKP
jgi:electron transfer flavoprotein alpha/beta subunit